MAMSQTSNKSTANSSDWAWGCGCVLVGLVGLGLYVWGCVWGWNRWLIPYFADVVQDTWGSVNGVTESLGRILGLQDCNWLLTFLTWLLLIWFVANRIWATIQPKVLRKYGYVMTLRGETIFMISVVVPAIVIILALAVYPWLKSINSWVNADGGASWRKTAWNLLMGDFCFKHNIVAAYFLFAPVALRWYLRFSFPREAIVFGYQLGEELSTNRDTYRFIPDEDKSLLFDDVKVDNKCKMILSKNVFHVKPFYGVTLYYCLVPDTRTIYMMVLSGHGEKGWKKARQSVESLFMSYKVKWTFPKNGISGEDEIFSMKHQIKSTSTQFECDSACRFNLRLIDYKQASMALGHSRVLAGGQWGHPKWKWKKHVPVEKSGRLKV